MISLHPNLFLSHSLTLCGFFFYHQPNQDVLNSPEVYIKTPSLYDFDPYDQTGIAAKQDSQTCEIETYELLQRHPHSNVCVYYGCARKDERVVGIVLRRYPRDLAGVVRNQEEIPNKARIIDDVRSALEHLHALGLVHNVINPTNIMLDRNDHVVPVDLGITGKKGETKSPYMGTPMWSRKSTASEPEINWFSFDLLKRWLDGERPEDETWPLQGF
jgi:serine/threonine protein kinase